MHTHTHIQGEVKCKQKPQVTHSLTGMRPLHRARTFAHSLFHTVAPSLSYSHAQFALYRFFMSVGNTRVRIRGKEKKKAPNSYT